MDRATERKADQIKNQIERLVSLTRGTRNSSAIVDLRSKWQNLHEILSNKTNV